MSSFAKTFYLIYSNKIFSFASLDNLKTSYQKNLSQTNNPSFQILNEFIYKTPYSFYVNNPKINNNLISNFPQDNLCRCWRLLKKNKEYLLNTGDIIKIGKVRLKIDLIRIKTNCGSSFITNNTNNLTNHKNSIYLQEQPTNLDNKNLIPYIKNDQQSETEILDISNNNIRNNKPICRICYKCSSSIKDPLISPCLCKGTMEYIHFSCLKKCIEAKIIKYNDNDFTLFLWKNFCCEVCKIEYPKYIKIGDNYFTLVDITNENECNSFISCDYSIFDDNSNSIIRCGFLVIKLNDNLDEEIISVGRSQINKVRLKEISISRSHCNFIKKNDKIFLSDKGSKFGTLLYMNTSLTIDENNMNQTIISGKYWLNINLKISQNFFDSFCPFKFCYCANDQNKIYDINVDKLTGNIDNNRVISNKEKIFKNKTNKNNEIEKINKNVDDSYKDLILELGDNIYIHEEIESENDED